MLDGGEEGPGSDFVGEIYGLDVDHVWCELACQLSICTFCLGSKPTKPCSPCGVLFRVQCVQLCLFFQVLARRIRLWFSPRGYCPKPLSAQGS